MHHHWSDVVWCGVDECSTTGVVCCGVERMMSAAPLEWCGVVWSGVVWCSVEWMSAAPLEWCGVEWMSAVPLECMKWSYVPHATICMWQCV